MGYPVAYPRVAISIAGGDRQVYPQSVQKGT